MNEPATAIGLLVPHDRRDRTAHDVIPLTGVAVHAQVAGVASRVRVVQSYENREDRPVEAVYVFPTPDGAAVCGFAVTVDGRRLEGRVEGRDEAFDEYDDAMAEGNMALLLDQERPNVLTASIGNLMPGEKVDVEIAYVAELDRAGDSVRLMIPTTVAPRYIPEHRRDFEGLNDGERVNPPVTTDALPYALRLTVDADLLSSIRTVESPSHKIRTEIDGPRVRVTLAGDDDRLDRDFVLLLTPSESCRPLSCLTEAAGERFAMASFRPELPEEREPVEVVFLVDCSGSMNGTSINEARRTLLLCLHSLQPGDRFNIGRFGSRHEFMSGKSVDYDDESLTWAKKYVSGMDADLGGTEILTPLKELLESPLAREQMRRVVLLTDGQVVNENDVIQLANEHQADSRIFAFGIGAGASEFLVRGVARASGGAAEFVYPGERIEEKVMRHFKRLTMPSVRFSVSWSGVEVEKVHPKRIPALCAGEMLTCMARVTGGSAGTATLHGDLGDRTISVEAGLEEGAGESARDIVPILWARHRIRELEESATWTESASGSLQRRRSVERQSREKEKMEEEITRLGTTFGLLSSRTSFVLVDERQDDKRAWTRAVLREVPTALALGWGGTAPSELFDCSIASQSVVPRSCDWMPDHSSGAEALNIVPEDPIFDLVLQQMADGGWELTGLLAKRLERDVAELAAVADESGHPDASRVLATLLVLELLDREYDETPEPWKIVIEKGRAWVRSATDGVAPPSGFAGWEEWALRSLPA